VGSGPHDHEREFSLMFNDDWTPAHLTGGPMNLYKEIALALKGLEWLGGWFVGWWLVVNGVCAVWL
jgi:hypothetical protein